MAKANPIFIPGTNQTFKSAAAAAKALGIDAGNISKVLRGKRKTAGGYSFGYANGRIYIPETGKSYGSIQEAARSVKVNHKKVENIVENNIGKTVKGYHFVYADASNIKPVFSTDSSSSATSKKNRTANKKERLQTRRQNKQKKYANQKKNEAIRKQEREASSARQARKQQERIDQIRANYDAYVKKQQTDSLLSNEVKELRNLMERINSQLKKYQEANMMGYSRIAQDVEEFQNYLGFTDDGMFDTSNENMINLMEEMSSEEINHWRTQLSFEADKEKGLFWNLQKQIQERAKYATQFGVSPEEMDAYVDLLPELWKIFEQARHYSMYDKVGQYMWNDIKKSVKSGISPQELKKVMDELKQWNGSSSKDLQEILGELEVSIHLESIFDNDDLPF